MREFFIIKVISISRVNTSIRERTKEMKRYMVKFHYPNSTTVHTAYESAHSRSEAANKVKAREAGCGRIVKIIATVER